jgi:hypothetical protein
MNACREPVSWLRLERYHLRELPPDERQKLAEHLCACPTCRAQLRQIEDDERTLPPLDLPAPARAAPRWRWLAFGAPILAAAVVLVLVLPPASPERPAARVAWKGGELALALVREREGVVQADPDSYRDGDRFAVLLTLPPGEHGWDLVVLQEDEASFPLAGGTTSGGNRVPLGAFVLTGPGDAAVCAVAGEERPTRERLRAEGVAALGEGAVCVGLRR